MNCPNCGADIEDNLSQCPVCGYGFEATEDIPQAEDMQTNAQPQIVAAEPTTKKSNAPMIVISVVCVLLVAAVCIMAYFLFNQKDNSTNDIPVTSVSSVNAAETDAESSNAETSSMVEESSSAAETTTTTSAPETTTTTTAETTTTTTKAEKSEPELSTKDLTNISESKLVGDYFGGIYDTDYISAGQYDIISLKNTAVFPYYKFGFNYMSADDIKGGDKPAVIHITEGGTLTGGGKVGMSYNELKAIYDFEGATFDGGTYGITAWTYIDGIRWGFEFDLSAQDKADLGVLDGLDFSMLGVPFDLSDIDPKCDLAYYIASLS